MLKTELVELVEKLKKEIKSHKQEKQWLSENIEEKDNEIQRLKNESNERINEMLKEKENEFNRLLKSLKDENKNLANKINEVYFSYGALLKTIQGTLDTHISLNDYIFHKAKGDK